MMPARLPAPCIWQACQTRPKRLALRMMRAMTCRHLYLAAYDVCDPARLVRALHLVRAYASGGQKSVYEVHLTPAERQHLLDDMQALLALEEDRFMLIRLDPRAKVETLGLAAAPSDTACLYFG